MNNKTRFFKITQKGKNPRYINLDRIDLIEVSGVNSLDIWYGAKDRVEFSCVPEEQLKELLAILDNVG
jgi:hypothetical protein